MPGVGVLHKQKHGQGFEGVDFIFGDFGESTIITKADIQIEGAGQSGQVFVFGAEGEGVFIKIQFYLVDISGLFFRAFVGVFTVFHFFGVDNDIFAKEIRVLGGGEDNGDAFGVDESVNIGVVGIFK